MLGFLPITSIINPILARFMANNGTKQDFIDLENLIKETDEKHRKAIEEMREQSLKAIEELKLLIAGLAIRASETAMLAQQQVHNGGNGNLGSSLGFNGVSRYTKFEFPRFDGSRVNEWTYKAEQFFEIDNTMEGIKVKLASIHLDGKALNWFQTFLKTREKGRFLLWTEFVESLIA